MGSELVSVIIPVYNSIRFLPETLSSVLTQTHQEIEVIIVDDGSTDDVREYVETIARTNSNVKYFFQTNQGVSAARNFGYGKSNGSYVAFLDSDDIWMPDNIEKKINLFKISDVGLVHSDALVINDKSELTGKILNGSEGFLLHALLEWSSTQIPGPSSALVRKEVLEKVGLFDTRLSTSADQDFFIRVATQFNIGRVKEPTWKYRIHEGNMHKNIKRMESDVCHVYNKAAQNRLFKSDWFRRRCFANMYLILAASWAGDGKNWSRSLYFVTKSLLSYPPVFIKILRKVWK